MKARCKNALNSDSAGGKEHRIRRCKIVAFAAQKDEFCECDEINDSDGAVAPAVARSKQPQQTAQPQRKCCGIHQSDLLCDELCRAQRDVFLAVRNVAQQLVCGPVMPRLPENVWQCDPECDKAT